VILSWSFVYAFNGEKQAYLGLANTVISNAALWSMIVAPFMMNWLGKRNLLIAHNILNVILLLLLIPCYKNLFLVCVIFYINTFVNTFQNIYFPNIQADMRDYHQWKTGVRVDGLFGPLGLIGTVLGFATGLVLPTIYEHMGLKENYDILYNDEMRNNLFDVLIAASIIGAILNLIPYLFYDLTEQKHRGYVNVLRIRAMFEDYGNNELDDAQLKEAMEIINASKNNLQKKAVDKAKLKEAKKLKDKQERATQTEKAREEIREVKNHNKLISSLPIVTEELGKFSTARYQAQLERARQTLSLGEVCLYSDWKEEKLSAKKMSRANKEERVIRADAIKTAMDKKRSYKLLKKYGEENLVAPDSSIPEEIKGRTFENEAQRRQAKKELKAYTKAVSVYRRITKPYYDAKNLIIQEENYRRLDEIEALYEKVISAEE
ncbi:MAG: MFS transporter, partial [Clostridia bacterium]|nr:MFS transporter [Clostridia bacterium]